MQGSLAYLRLVTPDRFMKLQLLHEFQDTAQSGSISRYDKGKHVSLSKLFVVTYPTASSRISSQVRHHHCSVPQAVQNHGGLPDDWYYQLHANQRTRCDTHDVQAPHAVQEVQRAVWHTPA